MRASLQNALSEKARSGTKFQNPRPGRQRRDPVGDVVSDFRAQGRFRFSPFGPTATFAALPQSSPYGTSCSCSASIAVAPRCAPA